MSRFTRKTASLELTGEGLTLDDAEHILHGQVEHLSLAPAARKLVERARRCLEDLIATGVVVPLGLDITRLTNFAGYVSWCAWLVAMAIVLWRTKPTSLPLTSTITFSPGGRTAKS